MSQNQLISSYTNTNINHDTNSSNSSSSPTMQDLMMSLLIDRSKVISSLQRTIEGLNDTIKALNNNVEKLEASRCTENVDKEVDKEVSKDVTQVFDKVTVTVDKNDKNVTTSSKSIHIDSVHKNVDPLRYEKEVTEVIVKVIDKEVSKNIDISENVHKNLQECLKNVQTLSENSSSNDSKRAESSHNIPVHKNGSSSKCSKDADKNKNKNDSHISVVHKNKNKNPERCSTQINVQNKMVKKAVQENVNNLKPNTKDETVHEKSKINIGLDAAKFASIINKETGIKIKPSKMIAGIT